MADNKKPVVNPNMSIWDQVCKTDPKATKRVSQRGGFTAIDAHAQIQRATEIFGPVGQGWGWELSAEYPPNDTVAVKVSLWFVAANGERHTGPIHFGGCNLKSSNGKADNDALKKAATDGITKCLSYWGFNADVFLGKFDDNKYVEAQKAANAPKRKEEADQVDEDLNAGRLHSFRMAVDAGNTPEALKETFAHYKDWIDAVKVSAPAYYEQAGTAYQRRYEDLKAEHEARKNG